MIRLFSRFDVFISFWGIFIFMIFIQNFLNLLFKVNFISNFFNLIYRYIDSFFQSIKPKSFNKVTQFIFFSLILIIFLCNFISIFPFFFPNFSQIRLRLFISLIFWSSLILSQISNNSKGFLFHLIPEGTPIYLTWFLFIIELTRNLIRPLTLTVRLVANILAGHLLIILLAKLVFINAFVFPFYLILNTVELFVGLIQSYIFVTIVCLYFREVH